MDTPECLERVKLELIVEILSLCHLLYKQNHKSVMGVLDSLYLMWNSCTIVYWNIENSSSVHTRIKHAEQCKDFFLKIYVYCSNVTLYKYVQLLLNLLSSQLYVWEICKYINTDHLCCTSMFIFNISHKQNNGTEENEFQRAVLGSEEPVSPSQCKEVRCFFKPLTLAAAQFHHCLSSRKGNQRPSYSTRSKSSLWKSHKEEKINDLAKQQISDDVEVD